LASEISQLSINPTDYHFDELVQNGSLSPAKKAEYEQKLQLIGQYTNAYSLNTGTLALSDFPAVDTPANQTVSKTVEWTVPAVTTYQSSVYPQTVTIDSISGNGAVVNPNNSISLVNTSTSAITYVIKLTVNLGEQTSMTYSTTWTNQKTGTRIAKSTATFGLFPKDTLYTYHGYVGGSKFEYLSTLLSKIDTSASMITTLYAAPTSDYTSLLTATTSQAFETASMSSMFNLYGNMDLTLLSARLSSQDVTNYQTMGQENIRKIIEAILTLNGTINSLDSDANTLNQNLPEDYFSSNIQALQHWYEQTMTNMETSYTSWKENSTTQLAQKPWSTYNKEETALYFDEEHALYGQLSALIKNTSQATKTISTNAKTVEDNSSAFQALVKSATTTQQDAQKILAGTNKLMLDGAGDLKTSKEYTTNFSKVLANTRTKGVDTNQLYDFFAQPLKITDISPKQASITVKKFDFQWVLIFLIGLIVGILSIYLVKMFSNIFDKKMDQFHT
jgi:methyl-accepting chemotaxis protein